MERIGSIVEILSSGSVAPQTWLSDFIPSMEPQLTKDEASVKTSAYYAELERVVTEAGGVIDEHDDVYGPEGDEEEITTAMRSIDPYDLPTEPKSDQ